MDQSRANVVEVPAFFFTLKVAQIALSVLVLALSAASIALEDGYGYYGGQGWAIFVCILTWIECGWYIASTRFMPKLYNRIPALVLEVLLWIKWLSVWTTLAYWSAWAGIFNDDVFGYRSVHAGVLQGVLGVAAALAAINWILIFTTAVVFVIHFLRYQRSDRPAAVPSTQPKYEMQPAPQQQQYQQQVPQQQYQAQQPYGQQYAQPQAQFDGSGEHKIAV